METLMIYIEKKHMLTLSIDNAYARSRPHTRKKFHSINIFIRRCLATKSSLSL